ncbi:chromophore lyase [Chryseobacterium sp. Leaf404]|uniref:T9SS type B sorting domain-containing protein n=1 Tax=unclassified Chryseobacterium TaxID=2593645 RepID=UPI0007010162|nr:MULTISPECIES: T9SS type B sorting domain-containing protein [unclassified Chryseobacterium]KQT17044.1 chromophore lyase [Chryseobacterium sp. Leaf404]
MKKTVLFLLIIISNFYYSQGDCVTALGVCGNSSITYSPTGIGNINETLGDCLSTGEHNSIWYKFKIATSGTLTFVINPADPTVDYDWAVYGPNTTCGSLGFPIRCNAATVIGVSPDTGLNMTNTNTTAAGGSLIPYCKYMDVIAGETYFLYLDNFQGGASTNVSPFTLTWGGTASLASPFTDPAILQFPLVPPGVPALNPSDPREILICTNPTVFNFSSLTPGILNGNSNFVVSYHNNQNDAISGANPIIAPVAVNTTSVYYYSVHYQDPLNPTNPINFCREIGKFKFKQGAITAYDGSLEVCPNVGTPNIGTFNLTLANVTNQPGVSKKYYPSLASAQTGTNEIIPGTAYLSANGFAYVKVSDVSGCFNIVKITLKVVPPKYSTVNLTLESCGNPGTPNTGTFNLTLASVTTLPGAVKKYYPSLADAQAGSNEISPANTYVSGNGVVYLGVYDNVNCYTIYKITLTVLPPKYSTVLKDQVICIDDRATLDAGPGFDSYEWSTGATTQAVSGLPVGLYSVILQSGNCFALQNVKVLPYTQPVITSIDITFQKVVINVSGGKAPYRYSMDGVNWQDSNIFTGVKRGEQTVYVKDANDCEEVEIEITVPNIVNAITPNGDGLNDFVDYSALAYKTNLVFTVYDRYGNKLFTADRFNDYKWDGTAGNKNILTGNYWFSFTWNEPKRNNTPVKYSGWILLKNRE